MADPFAGVDTSDAPYVIVSSDTHAGLQVEDYREHLESRYHRQFDEWAAEALKLWPAFSDAVLAEAG